MARPKKEPEPAAEPISKRGVNFSMWIELMIPPETLAEIYRQMEEERERIKAVRQLEREESQREENQ